MLIAHARSRGLVSNLVTNGTLITEERAQALKAAGLGSAQISIEGTTAQLHDSLVGRNGAFAQTLRGIAALQRAGIPTQTNTTINRENLYAIPAIPAFLASLRIERFAMNLFIPTIPGPIADRLFVPYEAVGSVVDGLMKEARRLGLTFFWYSPTPFCTYNPIARGQGNKSCAALDGLLSVAPDGSVLPCSSWDEPVGNLLSEPFRDIWLGPKSSYFKEKHFAPDACQSCSSFVACQGACPLYWRYTKTCPVGPYGDNRRKECVMISSPIPYRIAGLSIESRLVIYGLVSALGILIQVFSPQYRSTGILILLLPLPLLSARPWT